MDRAVEPRAELDLARQRRRPRSWPSVCMAIFQPSPRAPRRFSLGTTTSSRKSSQNSAWPVIWVIGRTSTPGGACRPAASRCHGAWGRPSPFGRAPAPARVLSPRDPRLLAADHEVVVVLGRARAQGGEVGAGLGLAEPLAPDLLGGEDRGDVAPRCSSLPKRSSDGPSTSSPTTLRTPGPRRGELLIDDDLLHGRPPAAAELARPGAADEAGLVAGGLPLRRTVILSSRARGSAAPTRGAWARKLRTSSWSTRSSSVARSFIELRSYQITPSEEGISCILESAWLN